MFGPLAFVAISSPRAPCPDFRVARVEIHLDNLKMYSPVWLASLGVGVFQSLVRAVVGL